MAVQSIAIGTVFGRLTVIGEGELLVNPNGKKSSRSRVRCECGVERVVVNSALKSGNTKSCGCSRGEEQHGKSQSPEYAVWRTMKDRCTNPNHISYANYGGRGITVCERWINSFVAFMEDMGPRQSAKHSIDRKNNDGNYEPGNCAWVTKLDQVNNARSNVLITFYGKTMTLTQWCHIAQINPGVVRNRLNSGWSEKKAFWTPVKSKRSLKSV